MSVGGSSFGAVAPWSIETAFYLGLQVQLFHYIRPHFQ